MFKYNNTTSESMGLILSSVPPIPLPQRRKEKQYIPDKSGYLTYDNRSWDEFSLHFQGHMFITATHTVDTIKNWLKEPSKLEYKYDDSYWEAEVLNEISFEFITPNLVKIDILFWCQPYRYLTSGLNRITRSSSQITNGFVLINEGNEPSEPIIEVYGTGKQTLTVNNQTISIDLGTDNVPVILNSKHRLVTKNFANGERLVSGELPIFYESNTIKGSSGITMLEIIPNWRSV